MAFRRVREAVEILTSSPRRRSYESPRDRVERFLPGMGHIAAVESEEHEELSPTALWLLAVCIVIPSATFLSKSIPTWVGTDSAAILLVAGWAAGVLSFHYAKTLKRMIPAKPVNAIVAPLEVFSVRRVAEAVAALTASHENAEQQKDP